MMFHLSQLLYSEMRNYTFPPAPFNRSVWFSARFCRQQHCWTNVLWSLVDGKAGLPQRTKGYWHHPCEPRIHAVHSKWCMFLAPMHSRLNLTLTGSFLCCWSWVRCARHSFSSWCSCGHRKVPTPHFRTLCHKSSLKLFEHRIPSVFVEMTCHYKCSSGTGFITIEFVCMVLVIWGCDMNRKCAKEKASLKRHSLWQFEVIYSFFHSNRQPFWKDKETCKGFWGP